MAAFPEARTHLAEGLAAYDEADYLVHRAISGYTPQIFGLGIAGWNEWFLGYPDRSREAALEAVTEARRIGYPQLVEQALNSAPHALLLQRAWEPALESIAPALAIAHQQGFHMRHAQIRVMQGWALSLQGAGHEAVVQLAAAVFDYRATGARAWQTNFLALLALAHCRAGLIADGLQTIGEARELSMNQAEHWWDAELSRIEGDLHLASSGSQDGRAEECYRNAIETARRQQARSWELRAATSLARLLGNQRRRAEAQELLAPIYGWFTEGFDTADLKEAKALLGELT